MKSIRLFLAGALVASAFAATVPALSQTSTPTVLAPVSAVDASATTAPVTADTAVVVEDANKITIPVANWVDQIAVVVRDLGTAFLPILIGLVLTALPAPIRMIAGPFIQKYSSGVLDKALDYGVNAVKGATKDKPLTIGVGNSVLAHAAQYAIDHGPAWWVKAMGGEDGLRQKIFARLNLPVDAGIEDFAAQVTPAVGDTKAAKVTKSAKVLQPRYPLAK